MDNEQIKGGLDKKALDYVDKLIGKPAGMVKHAYPSASMRNTSYRNYRSSFLTLADFEIPSDYRDIFKWCRWFFKFDPLIGGAVRSLATFPVTDYILNDTTEADERDVVHDCSIHLIAFAVIDYVCYKSLCFERKSEMSSQSVART